MLEYDTILYCKLQVFFQYFSKNFSAQKHPGSKQYQGFRGFYVWIFHTFPYSRFCTKTAPICDVVIAPYKKHLVIILQVTLYTIIYNI